MTGRSATPTLCALIMTFALAGCTPPATDPTSATATPEVSSTATSPAPSASPNGSRPHDDATALPVPVAGTDSQTAAVAAAEKVVRTFAQPALDAHTWITNLYPLLTQAGAAAYEDTDPATIPIHAVTGPGIVLDSPTDVALIVQLPTDAGPYTVSLSRKNPTGPWLADRIRPTEG